MLTSTLFVLSVLATSMPALAAPTHVRRGDGDKSSALEARRCYAIGKRDNSDPCGYTNVGLLHPNLKILGLRDVDTSADSGAFSLEDAAHVASIGSNLVNIGESVFEGTKKQRDESGALAKFCPIVARAGIFPSACPTEPLATSPFHLSEIFKRAKDQSSGAFSLGDAAHVASIGSSLVNIGEDIFGKGKASRELEVARDDSSEAISLGTIGTIVSVAAPVIGGIINHFTNQQQRDYLMEELVARSILNELD